ncbi:hypothetical protein K438DRAFT_1757916 [Mycena galopus ATCC 62051]|nr:hypothetical protein K438DRAFT_1757916 [Mycena galopus ATCC 62051]
MPLPDFKERGASPPRCAMNIKNSTGISPHESWDKWRLASRALFSPKTVWRGILTVRAKREQFDPKKQVPRQLFSRPFISSSSGRTPIYRTGEQSLFTTLLLPDLAFLLSVHNKPLGNQVDWIRENVVGSRWDGSARSRTKSSAREHQEDILCVQNFASAGRERSEIKVGWIRAQ